jgi:glycine/D-amino acid oxidase-like deaminating enzyme
LKRVVVVGAGIIGLACAWRLQKSGAHVTVVDRSPVGDKCSFGNAGGIAVTEIIPASVPGLTWRIPGWLVDPQGPLFIRWRHVPRLIPWMTAFLKAGNVDAVERAASALAALNRLVYSDLIPMLADLHLSSDLRQAGAISLYTSQRAFQRDASEWHLRTRLGIDWSLLSPADLAKLEPDLAPAFQVGVWLPTWSHVADPKRIVDRLRETLVQRGAAIKTLAVVDFDLQGTTATRVLAQNGESVSGDAFIVATGAWSAELAGKLGDQLLIESERGYNTTIAAPNMKIQHELIFAESKFVVTPLESGLRVGGAAEFGGLHSPPNFKRSRALLELAKQALPNMPTSGGTTWMGNRPATPDSLPVIGTSERAVNVYYACGHGHLGLTQAAPTARLIDELLFGWTPSLDLNPFSPKRFPRITRDIRQARG